MTEEQFTNPEEMLNSFVNSQSKNEFVEILKELFDPSKLEMITELSDDEIKLITRIKLISDLKKLTGYGDALKYYMTLKLSHKRKSRTEIIEAFKGFMMGGVITAKKGLFKGGNNGQM